MSGQAGQEVVELGQLHLHLGDAGAGVPGEDVEDDGTAIEDPHFRQLFQVSHLSGGQVVVEDNELGARPVGEARELGGLALADVVRRINTPPHLQDSVHHVEAGSVGQTAQLVEGILDLPARCSR